jgi:hypothetical protein
VVLGLGHTLRAHEALSCSDALSGFLEVVHRLFEDGVFVGHDQSIRVGIVRSPDCFAFSRERADRALLRKGGRSELPPQNARPTISATPRSANVPTTT